jgi:hypothetical protein
MLQTTAQIVRTALSADPSVSASERQRLMKLLRDGMGANPPAPTAPEPRIILRAEAARRLGVSLRALDGWAKQGLLPRVRLPGRVRAAGFRESDICELIQGRQHEAHA